MGQSSRFRESGRRAIPKNMSGTVLIVILVVVMAVAASKALRRSLVLLAAMAAFAVLVLRLLAAHGPT